MSPEGVRRWRIAGIATVLAVLVGLSFAAATVLRTAPADEPPAGREGPPAGVESGPAEPGDPGAAAAGPDELVILLDNVQSQISTYHEVWPGYAMPLLALWADGRILVLDHGGWAGTPVYLEAWLDETELDRLRGWIEEADLRSLAPQYPRPQTGGTHIMVFDAPVMRIRARSAGVRSAVTYTLLYPVGDVLLPARLDTLDRRLRDYRPPNGHVYVHESIEVVVRERARTALEGTYFPLPPEFALDGMTETYRSVEEVRYMKTFSGEEAARIAARIDAGEWLYQDDRRSYRVTYLPLIDWPRP